MRGCGEMVVFSNLRSQFRKDNQSRVAMEGPFKYTDSVAVCGEKRGKITGGG